MTPLQIKDLVLETIKLFGASRCMFASNYPVDKVEMSPAPLYRQFTEFVEGVEEEDRKHLFVGTAEKFYRF
jgi:predicted TIM-barrel fold metal-dependent hydrolase